MTFATDIDLDFKDRTDACRVVPHIAASMHQKGELIRHPSGIYLQDIPAHPFCDFSALDYDRAEKYGYFKIDFLTNTVYEGVRDKQHLLDLMNREVPWDFFLDRGVVSRLSHIHNHYGIVMAIRPQSILDLSIVLALIRPSKKHLAFRPRAEIDAEIWVRDAGNYAFKKAHAVAYAVSIVVQLQLLIEQTGAELDAGGSNDFAF